MCFTQLHLLFFLMLRLSQSLAQEGPLPPCICFQAPQGVLVSPSIFLPLEMSCSSKMTHVLLVRYLDATIWICYVLIISKFPQQTELGNAYLTNENKILILSSY